MSPPLRPTAAPSRPEPRLGAAAEEPPRASAPRQSGIRPGAETGGPLRFPAGLRHGHDTRLSLTEADRVIVSSEFTGGARGRKRPRLLRSLALAVLFLLATFGAYSLYHAFAGILHP